MNNKWFKKWIKIKFILERIFADYVLILVIAGLAFYAGFYYSQSTVEISFEQLDQDTFYDFVFFDIWLNVTDDFDYYFVIDYNITSETLTVNAIGGSINSVHNFSIIAFYPALIKYTWYEYEIIPYEYAESQFIQYYSVISFTPKNNYFQIKGITFWKLTK